MVRERAVSSYAEMLAEDSERHTSFRASQSTNCLGLLCLPSLFRVLFTVSRKCAMKYALALLLIVVCSRPEGVRAYGRLQEPPGRGSLWRYGYDAPVNEADDENDCGGADRLWHINGGNCGMCGDAYDLPVPRPHEIGGLYGKGLITRSYLPGAYVDVELNFTRHAGGYLQFSICKIEDFASPGLAATTAAAAAAAPPPESRGTFGRRRRGSRPIKCKSRRPLDVQEIDEPLYTLNTAQDILRLHVKLPRRYQCQWCVLIWEYWTGSSCGFDQDCSTPQGHLRSCADIRILADPTEAKYPLAQTTTTTMRPPLLPSAKNGKTGGQTATESHLDDDVNDRKSNLFDFEGYRIYVMNQLSPSL